MRNLLLISLLFFINLNVLSQDSLRWVAGISFSKSNASINLSSGGAGNIGIFFGPQFETEQGGELNTSLAYQFTTEDFSSLNVFSKTPSSALRTHFLGGKLKYLFRKKEHIFRPFFEVDMLLRVGSNYKKGYPSSNGFVIVDGEIRTDNHGTYEYFQQYTTPFIGGVLIGCDFRISEHVNLNLGAGYGLGTIKTMERKWYTNYTIYDEKNPSSSVVEREVYQMINFRIGISYAFSLKKNK